MMRHTRRTTDRSRQRGHSTVGEVVGTVVEDDAVNLAHENGMYVIVQSGYATEIMPVSEGFTVKEW